MKHLLSVRSIIYEKKIMKREMNHTMYEVCIDDELKVAIR